MQSTESSDELTAGAAAFAEFLARVDAGESVDFDAFCAERPELEKRLRLLQAQWGSLSGALDDMARTPAGEAARDPSSRATTDDSAGGLVERLRRVDPERYAVKDEIARGGMGAILKVFDQDLRRSLAMKVLLGSRGPGRVEPRSLARFLDEAQITGQLEHPGILPVYELGLDADGRVYFTMPLVRGEDFQTIIAHVHAGESGWTLTRALGVVVRVCEATGYAHSRGVLHRDLKPANVMVGPFGETYVMDWGLARVLGEEDQRDIRLVAARAAVSTEVRTVRTDETPDSPLMTMDGDVVGTPVYMSPEQAQGWIDALGPASDVYSIGGMLYHLLTGHRPYLSPGEEDSAIAVLRAVKTRAARPIHALAPDVPAELEAICEKAMARDPAARYASTMEMADDLRAYLERRVVRAYQTGPLAEAKKWVQRNRRLALASAAAVAALAAGFATSTFFAFQSRSNEKDAIEERIRADENAGRLAAELRSSNIQRGRSMGRAGQVAHAENLLWREHLQDASSLESRWGLWELYSREPGLFSHSAPPGGGIRGVICSWDQSLAFVASSQRRYQDGRIEIWDMASFEKVAELGGHGNEISAMSLHPEGNLLASSSFDGTIGLWDLITHRRTRTLRTEGADFNAVGFGHDGTRFVSADAAGRLDVWDTSTGERLATVRHDDSVIVLALHPTEDLFASGTGGGSVRLWRGFDPPTATDLGRRESDVLSLAFSPDGRTLVCCHRDSTLEVWDVETATRLTTLDARNGAVRALGFDPSGSELYVGGWYRIDRYDVATLEVTGSFTSNRGVMDVVPSTDRRTLMAVSTGHLRVWDLLPGRAATRLGGHVGRVAAAVGADGARIATGDEEGRLRIWDAATGELLETWEAAPGAIQALGLDPSGRYVAVGSGSVLRIHDARTRSVIHAFEGLAGATQDLVDFSPDGGEVVFATSGGTCEIRELSSGDLKAEVGGDGTQVIALRYDAAGRFFAVITRDYPAGPWTTIWSPAGERLFHYESRYVWKGAPSPDGTRLATGSFGHEIRTWNIAEGRLEQTLEGHAGKAWAADWHPRDPRLVASCGGDGTVMLWDVETGRNLLAIEVFDGSDATWIRFGPAGRTLFVAGNDGNAAILDLEYFDRHVAGNVRDQIERFRPELGESIDAEALEAWTDEVLARPWPRLGRPPKTGGD